MSSNTRTTPRSLPRPPSRVNNRNVYEYALRCVLITTVSVTSPGPGPASVTAAQASAAPSSATSAPAAGGAVRNSVRVTKDFLKPLQKRLSAISSGARPVLPDGPDPEVFRLLALFGGVTMQDKKFKERMKNGTVADLLSSYLEFVVISGVRAPGTQAPYVRGFVKVASDCLNSDVIGIATIPALLRELGSFEGMISGTKKDNGAGGGGPTSSAALASDPEGLLAWLRKSMGISQQDHDQAVQQLRPYVHQQAAFDDLKLCLYALDQDVHPSARMSDFTDVEAYELWKRREKAQINQLIIGMATLQPELASRSSLDFQKTLIEQERAREASLSPGGTRPSSITSHHQASGYMDARMQHQAAQQPIKSPYAFVPRNPRDYYKLLVHACLDAELRTRRTLDARFFGPKSSGVLKECGLRWRLMPTFRVVALLDAVRQKCDEGVVTVEQVRDALIQLEKTAKQNAAADGTGAERRFLFQVFVSINRSMLQRLLTALMQFDSISKEEIAPIIRILDDVHSDETFRRSFPDVDKCVEEVLTTLRIAAGTRFNSLNVEATETAYENALGDTAKLLTVAEMIQSEAKLLGKKFPDLILGKIDVAANIIKAYLELFMDEMEKLMKSAEDDPMGPDGRPSEEVFSLYHSSRALWALCRHAKLDLGKDFTVTRWFMPFILSWLRVTESKTREWVGNAIQLDKFTPIADDMQHSSSVLDLFSVFQQQLNFLDGLEWPDEVEHCKFLTQLAGIIGKAISQYCDAVEDLFRQDLYPAVVLTSDSSGSTLSWFERAKSLASKPTRVPVKITVLPETCVKLNDIEEVQRRLDDLYNTLAVDAVAEVLGESEVFLNETKPDRPIYIYSVKIVMAEGLRSMDSSGLSDPYVVLQSGTVELARTRVIYETLDPRFDEVFEIRLDVPIVVQAIVYDKDMVADDLCGRCKFQLQPSLYNDFMSHDLWLNLDTQGRLLIRISMEGERNDIRFHFGKSFRTLKRTQTDMARMVIEQMSGYIRFCLSSEELFRVIRAKEGTKFFGASTGKRDFATTDECDEALGSLIEYLDDNMSTLFQHLKDDVAKMVFGQLWKEVLTTFESLMIPPLSDKPTGMKQLDEFELKMTFDCLELMKLYFNGGDEGDGVPMDELENARYRGLLAVREYYSMSGDELLRAYFREMEKEKGVRGSIRRNKTLTAKRNIGTIKSRAAGKRKETAETAECILRVMRLHKECLAFLSEIMASRGPQEKALPAVPPKD